MVQWLRLCAFNAGGVRSIPDQGTLRSHLLHGITKKFKKYFLASCGHCSAHSPTGSSPSPLSPAWPPAAPLCMLPNSSEFEFLNTYSVLHTNTLAHTDWVVCACHISVHVSVHGQVHLRIRWVDRYWGQGQASGQAGWVRGPAGDKVCVQERGQEGRWQEGVKVLVVRVGIQGGSLWLHGKDRWVCWPTSEEELLFFFFIYFY